MEETKIAGQRKNEAGHKKKTPGRDKNGPLQRILYVLADFFFFLPREQKKCSFSKTFLDPEDFSERTERKERRVAESVAKGCGVRSEAGVPFRGGLAEDVAARSGRRSDPKRLEWSEWRKRRRDPKNV